MPCSFYKTLFICISGILIFIFCYPNAVLPTTIATAEEGDGVYFDDLMGEYSTSYSSSGSSRKNNIELAAKALNGTKVNAGEKFSFNKTVGIRSAKRGYLPAPVIENGKYVDGVGGGVCQVSTTLYNAVIRSGFENVSAVRHTIPAGYVPLSSDAAVSEVTDFVFRNDTPYPVNIECVAENGKLTVRLYGFPYYTDGLSVKFVSNLIKETPCTEYETEPDYSGALLPGEGERIVRAALPRRESELIKITYYMGKEVERKRFRRDVYPAVPGIKIKAAAKLPEIPVFATGSAETARRAASLLRS